MTASWTRMSPSRRPSPAFCSARAVQIGGGDLARPHQPCADRLPVAADGGRHHAPTIEADGTRRLAKLRRHPQHTALPPQIEQLEDVLNVQLLERSLERHRSPRRGGEDVLE